MACWYFARNLQACAGQWGNGAQYESGRRAWRPPTSAAWKPRGRNLAACLPALAVPARGALGAQGVPAAAPRGKNCFPNNHAPGRLTDPLRLRVRDGRARVARPPPPPTRPPAKPPHTLTVSPPGPRTARAERPRFVTGALRRRGPHRRRPSAHSPHHARQPSSTSAGTGGPRDPGRRRRPRLLAAGGPKGRGGRGEPVAGPAAFRTLPLASE